MTTASVIRTIVEFAVAILIVVGFVYEHKLIAFEDRISAVIAALRSAKAERIAEEQRAIERRQRQDILDRKRASYDELRKKELIKAVTADTPDNRPRRTEFWVA